MTRIRLPRASKCECGGGLEPVDDHPQAPAPEQTIVQVSSADKAPGCCETSASDGASQGCCGGGTGETCCSGEASGRCCG